MVSVTAGYKGVAVEIPVKSFHHGDDVPDVQIIAEPGIGKDDADLFAVGTAEVPDASKINKFAVSEISAFPAYNPL